MKKKRTFPNFEPFDLVIEIHSVASDDVGCPDCAVVKMTPDLLKKICDVSHLCIEHGLESATLAMKPDRWLYGYKVEGDSLHVWGDSFWFKADVKHGDRSVETCPVCLSDLLDLLNGRPVEEMTDTNAVWSNGTLFCATEPENLPEIIETYETYKICQEPA